MERVGESTPDWTRIGTTIAGSWGIAKGKSQARGDLVVTYAGQATGVSMAAQHRCHEPLFILSEGDPGWLVPI